MPDLGDQKHDRPSLTTFVCFLLGGNDVCRESRCDLPLERGVSPLNEREAFLHVPDRELMVPVSAYPQDSFFFLFVKFDSSSEVLNQASHLVFAPCTEL